MKPKIDKLFLLIIIAFIYAIIYSTLLILQFKNFSIGGLDFANYLQGIWKISKGIAPVLTAIQSHLLEVHLSFIWYPVGALFIIWPSAYWLLILHVVSITSVSLIVFLMAKEISGNDHISFLLALCYLFSQYTQRALFSPIHPDSFEIFFVSLSLLFVLREKYFPYLLFFLVSIVCNEDVGLYFIPIGFFLYFVKKQRTWGGLTVICSLMWLFAIFKLKPYFGADTQNLINRFSFFGNSAESIIKHIAFKPWILVVPLFQISRLSSLLQMFLQVGFLPLVSLWGSIIVLVPLLFKSLTNHSGMYQFWDHYSLAVLPFLWFSAIWGTKKLLFITGKSEQWIEQIVICILVINIGFQAFLPYSPLSLRFNWRSLEQSEKIYSGWRIIEHIPAEASVLTQENVCPALACRKIIYVIHRPGHVFQGAPLWLADYVIFDRSKFEGNWLEAQLKATDSFLAQSANYKVELENNGWVLYKQKH